MNIFDHCKSHFDFFMAGIPLYFSEETCEGLMPISMGYNTDTLIEAGTKTRIGQFTILPFDVKHDVPTLGFLIHHPECGVTLFATDTYYLPNTFSGLNNIIIESNYCEDIIAQRSDKNKWIADRVYKSHMSIQHCIEALQANDLSAVNNIVLIHLSDANSNAEQFKQKVIAATGKRTFVAEPGLTIEFNKTL